MEQEKFKLNEQTYIPALGFGTWQLTGDTCTKSVEYALEIGYRHVDTADAYGNHEEVGKVINKSGLKRDEIFLTSKVWRSDLKKNDVANSCNRALDELSTEYLDLLLIHWPDRQVPIAETLEALSELKSQGLIKSIGVSNFTVNHLKDALDTGFEFSNNQVEFHPSLNQTELKEFCDKHGIIITAYSPIAQGQDLKLQEVQEISEKYGRSKSQVILNWLIQKKIVAIPRSSKPEHIKDNYGTLEWKLENEDAELLSNINQHNRTVNPGFGDFDY